MRRAAGKGHQSYWAWLWTNAGPVRLNVATAEWGAIRRVAPGLESSPYSGLDIDWPALYWRAFVMAADRCLNIWFNLADGQLVPARGEVVDCRDAGRVLKRWP